MEKRTLEVGDILQINPEHDSFPGFFVIVTDPKDWGAQGYLIHSRDFEAVKFKGRAFVRVKFEDIEFCGRAEWVEYDKEYEVEE